MIEEYNRSGNPGRFSVIYDGDYAHVVQTKRSIDGQLQEFQPILSTIVPVGKSQGSCEDVLAGLWGELQDLRGIKPVMEFAVPAVALLYQQCSIRGHGIAARDVLIQVLDQIDLHPRTHERVARFAWSFLHDPTTDRYFLNTQAFPKPDPTPAPPKK